MEMQRNRGASGKRVYTVLCGTNGVESSFYDGAGELGLTINKLDGKPAVLKLNGKALLPR